MEASAIAALIWICAYDCADKPESMEWAGFMSARVKDLLPEVKAQRAAFKALSENDPSKTSLIDATRKLFLCSRCGNENKVIANPVALPMKRRSLLGDDEEEVALNDEMSSW